MSPSLEFGKILMVAHNRRLTTLGVRQRSGEGVVRENGRPKRCLLESLFLLFPLTVFRCFKGKPYWGRQETNSPKNTLLDDRFPARRLLRSFGTL